MYGRLLNEKTANRIDIGNLAGTRFLCGTTAANASTCPSSGTSTCTCSRSSSGARGTRDYNPEAAINATSTFTATSTGPSASSSTDTSERSSAGECRRTLG